jgi:hypothetical protein
MKRLAIVNREGQIATYQGEHMVFDDTPEERQRAENILSTLSRAAVNGPFELVPCLQPMTVLEHHDRYRNDAKFAYMVDSIIKTVEDGTLYLGDIREALELAEKYLRSRR